MACNFSHVYSLWISWRGVRLSHALVFHMSKPVFQLGLNKYYYIGVPLLRSFWQLICFSSGVYHHADNSVTSCYDSLFGYCFWMFYMSALGLLLEHDLGNGHFGVLCLISILCTWISLETSLQQIQDCQQYIPGIDDQYGSPLPTWNKNFDGSVNFGEFGRVCFPHITTWYN